MQILSNSLTKNDVSIINDSLSTVSYINSTCGHTQLEAECPAEIVTEIYRAWGDTPTVVEPAPIPQPDPQPSVTDILGKQLVNFMLGGK